MSALGQKQTADRSFRSQWFGGVSLPARKGDQGRGADRPALSSSVALIPFVRRAKHALDSPRRHDKRQIKEKRGHVATVPQGAGLGAVASHASTITSLPYLARAGELSGARGYDPAMLHTFALPSG